MANKKISELQSRTPALSDLMLVGDPSSGYSYKCTVTALATIIETDIADGYVTIGTTQTISGAKTFSNNLTLTSVVNTPTDTDKFLTLNASNVVTYRTGAEVLSDIGGQASLSGTGLVKSTSGTISYITDNSSNWNTAYNDSIVSAAVSGTTTKTLTLTQQDGGTLTASWSDLNTDAVTSVFGRTGAVVATEGDYSLNLLSDVTLTSPSNGQVLKYNGTAWVNDTDANTGTVTSVGLSSATSGVTIGSTPITTSGTITLAIATASGSQQGLLSSTDWTIFNNKIGGSGTTNYVSKFTGSGTIGNSQIFDNGTNVGIGTNTPSRTLDVNGIITTNNNLELTSANPTILWTTSNLRFYNNTNGVVATISSAGQLSLSSIPNATTDTDKFLVSDGGVVKYRTGSEVLSDIGAASSSSISGTTNYIPKFTSSSAIGNSLVYETGSHIVINGTTNGTALNTSVTVNDPTAGNYSGFIPMTNNVQRGYYGGTSTGLEIGTGGIFTIWTGGSERMRLDASGNLGLGTSSPTNKLDILTADNTGLTVRSTNYSGSFSPSGLGGMALTTNGAYPLFFYLNSATRMTLDASGNLGLGVSPSAWSTARAFDMSGGVGIASINNESYYVNNAYYSDTWRYKASSYAQFYNQNSTGEHRWYNAPSGTAGNAISFTQAMTLDASGNLGVGTTTANAKLNLFKSGNGLAMLDIYSDQGTNGNTSYIRFGEQSRVGNNDSRKGAIIYQATGSWNRGNMIFALNNAANTTDVSTSDAVMTLLPSGNVGISTTSPVYKLDVRGQGYFATSAGTNQLTLGDITNGTISAFQSNNSNLIFFPDGSNERMRITSGGNVGIGTTTPDMLLSVRGTDNTAVSSSTFWNFSFEGAELSNLSNTVNTVTGLVLTGGSNRTSISAVANILESTSLGALAFFTGGSGVANTIPERMRITSGGNVGIGTTSPDNKLSVRNEASSAIAVIDVRGGVGGAGAVAISGNGTILTSTSFDLIQNSAGAFVLQRDNNPLVFGTNNTERMRITSGGNVGIGTSSPFSNAKFQVKTGTDINVAVQTGTTDATGIKINAFNDAGSANIPLEINGSTLILKTGESERARITTSGELLINTTSDAGDYKLQVNGNIYIPTGANMAFGTTGSIFVSPSTSHMYIEYPASNSLIFRDITSGTAALTLTSSENAEFGGSIKTAAPSGGTAKPWKLGEAGVTLGGSNTSGVRVEIDGVVYYLVTGYLP